MKTFISKNQNLRVVLKHGMSAEPLTGRNAVSGVYVKFVGGRAVVDNDEIVDMMLKHVGFGSDFILVNEEEIRDPFAGRRRAAEPEHDMVELNYGHIGKNMNPKKSITLQPEQQAALTEIARGMAKEMAMQMAPELAKKIVVDLLKDGTLAEAAKPAKRGRKPKKESTDASGSPEVPTDEVSS